MAIQYYADPDVSGNIVGFYNDDVWEVAKIPETAIEITQEEWQDAVANQGKYIVKSGTLANAPAPSVEQLLVNAKAAKITEMDVTAEKKLKTFTSSALGTPHTYLCDDQAMTLLTGEYAYVKANDYDGELIPWYTFEDGYTLHTDAQFVQVYLDARRNVQDVKVRHDTLIKQIGDCTTIEDVEAIEW